MKQIIMPAVFGTWRVTTEGDCEGRSTRELGTHTGYFDEVALKLADKAYYGLRLDPVDPNALKNVKPTRAEVQVSLGIDSGSWDTDKTQRVRLFREMLRDRPGVLVEAGEYYACVKLIGANSPEGIARIQQDALAQQAANKLDPLELKALIAALKEKQ